MGKRRDRHDGFEINNDYDNNHAHAFLNDIDYDLDDEDFDKQFQQKLQNKKTRRSAKRTLDARRRIEEYREERDLKRRLSEFYDDF